MPLELPSSDPRPLPAGVERTDAFHRRPLFLVEPRPGGHEPPKVVRSWNEAHALHGPARSADVNPAYVAALISGTMNAGIAPYRRIRRLPRAHQVLIRSDGSVHTSAFDPLAGGAAAMEPESLHHVLREGLLDHVRRALAGHAGAIGCEHSSGLDSNAVLGALVHGVGLAPERLHTWSNEGGGEGEPLQEFRLFHRLRPEQCHRHSPQEEAQPVALEDAGRLQLEVFGAPAQIGGLPLSVRMLQEQGCTVLFSGFGGDQAVSHNAMNVPTDLVVQGRWRQLLQWMGNRRWALKTAVDRSLGHHIRPWAVRQVRRRSRNFCRIDLLERSLTSAGRSWLGPFLHDSYPWEIDAYLPQHQSIRQRVLADWVAVRAEEETRMAAAHGMAKAFPLLDESLISNLLQQDPVLFGEGAGRGRLLHRRAFAPFLPPFLRDNPSKDRISEGDLEGWESTMRTRQQDALERDLAAASDWHPELARLFELTAIRQEAERIHSSTEPTMKELMGTTRALTTLGQLSGWWQALED